MKRDSNVTMRELGQRLHRIESYPAISADSKYNSKLQQEISKC